VRRGDGLHRRGMSGMILAARARPAPACGNKKPPRGDPRRRCKENRKEASVLGRPGSDLLFQVLRLSTIGAGKFNGRVRDGIGYRLPANTTRPAKDGLKQAWAQASAQPSDLIRGPGVASVVFIHSI